ncbi:MAG: hypothetical protein HUU38_12620 [Anaerolineales bacterium]|nr:hypothetical protein [Anaerolineales bacterium]
MNSDRPFKQIATVPRFWRGFHAPGMYVALGLFVFCIFGLRDIVITGMVARFTKNDLVFVVLDGVYSLGLLGAGVLMGVYFYFNRALWAQTLTARRREFGYLFVSLLLVTPFLYLMMTQRFFLDYWLDEMMSIVRHIYPSLSSALFWYPAPNNHIFSNALTGIYLQVIGHPDMLAIVQNPLLLRSLYLGFGLGAILLFAFTAYRFLGLWAGWMAVILLCTTVPYLNFIVQVRGYSPSIFFSAALLFFILRYREAPRRNDALAVGLLAMLLFYTIPSNLYFLGGLGIFFAGMSGLAWWRKTEPRGVRLTRDQFVVVNQDFTLGLMIALGMAISVVFYLPVWPQVVGNKFVERNEFLQGTAIPDSLLYVIQLFLSNRFVIFAVAGIGTAWAWVNAWRAKDEKRLYPIHLCLAGFLLPFVISFIRGDRPYERIFLVTLPLFIFLFAIGFQQGLNHLLTRGTTPQTARFLPGLSLAAIFLYANLTFFTTFQQIEQRIYTNLTAEEAIQVEVYDDTLWASHHLDHYSLNSVIAAFLDVYDGQTPVLIDDNDTRFPWVIGIFLEAYGVPFTEIETVPDPTLSEAYVFLSFPARSLTELQTVFPGAACTQISEDISVYRVMHCQFK